MLRNVVGNYECTDPRYSRSLCSHAWVIGDKGVAKIQNLLDGMTYYLILI
jgi:hypothetical protein